MSLPPQSSQKKLEKEQAKEVSACRHGVPEAALSADWERGMGARLLFGHTFPWANPFPFLLSRALAEGSPCSVQPGHVPRHIAGTLPV